MKNRFLLFMGMFYYPSGGTGDLISMSETLDEAFIDFHKEMSADYPPDWAEIFDVEKGERVYMYQQGI